MSQPTPAEKFRIALDLHEVGLHMHEQALHRRYPEADDEQIREALFAWRTRQTTACGLGVRDTEDSSNMRSKTMWYDFPYNLCTI